MREVVSLSGSQEVDNWVGYLGWNVREQIAALVLFFRYQVPSDLTACCYHYLWKYVAGIFYLQLGYICYSRFVYSLNEIIYNPFAYLYIMHIYMAVSSRIIVAITNICTSIIFATSM